MVTSLRGTQCGSHTLIWEEPVKTIRRWIAAGTLTVYRCGKRVIRDQSQKPRSRPSTNSIGALIRVRAVRSKGFLANRQSISQQAHSFETVML